MLNTIFALTATTTGVAGNPPTANWTSWILPIVMIGAIVLMFVFSSRSQKKRDKEVNDMRNSLRIGDEVTTTGGIIGRVVSVKEETVVIETSRDGTKIRFLKSAIARVDVTAEDANAATKQETK
jgi:preprotein translocase subunit YajC